MKLGDLLAAQCKETIQEFEPPNYPKWHTGSGEEDPKLPTNFTVQLNNIEYHCHKSIVCFGKRSAFYFYSSFDNATDATPFGRQC